uniref:Uncharacterized protein n=1 Tax=Schistosoma haematobium TaxID=6185 RepID=A0A094ZJM0_SCHHA
MDMLEYILSISNGSIRSHAYNHKIVRFNSRSGNNSLNQSTINKDPPEEKSNESTVYNQYWSTNDLLSFECGSNDNEKWHHSNETEYHRANLDDRLGVNFNSGIFDWSQSESWLIVQNAIINTILCKPNLDISEAVRNMRSSFYAMASVQTNICKVLYSSIVNVKYP